MNPNTPIVYFTSEALSKIKFLSKGSNIPENYSLRLGMKGGGCGGMSYLIGFDKERENDSKFIIEGLTVLVDKAHSMYILGMEIDYVENGDQVGFVFNNPVKKKSVSEE